MGTQSTAAFGYMMALMQVPAKATMFFVTFASNKYVLLLMINVLLIALGTFMNMAPMILSCTPILLPVVKSFGVDPPAPSPEDEKEDHD